MKSICIISSQHISANPRVWKEADSLSRNGYNVTIVTICNSRVHRERDKARLEGIPHVKYVVAANIIYNEIPLYRRLKYHALGMWGKMLKNAGVDNIFLLTRTADEVYQAALNINADFYIAHTEPGLYIGKRLINNGRNVAFDFEDWYSRDYLVPSRPVKLLWRLEDFALRNGSYVTCPSQAMAGALQKEHGNVQVPGVIYNSFKAEPVGSWEENKVPSLVWFSQTIGPGRGLEKIFSVLENVSVRVELTLVGTCSDSYKNNLVQIFPSNLHSLKIIPQVPHHELHTLLTRYDIGLALEETYPDSRDKTITNKILQYLQAGIKVFATGTAGQTEVASHIPESVTVVKAGDTTTWHLALEELINKKVNRRYSLELYEEVFSWQKQEEKLLQLVKNAIG